jgi:nitrous oxidase accessory protein NosD
MHPYSMYRRIFTSSSLILGLAVASCQSGPTSLDDRFVLSATELIFQDQVQQQVSIKNLGSEPLAWRIEGSSASWLNGAPGSGSVDPHGTAPLVVRIAREAVPQGTHSGSLQIGAGGQSRTLTVSVQPPSAPDASLTPNQISFGTTGVSAVVDVVNSGGSVLEWTLSGPVWVTISPSSGNLDPGATKHVVLTALRSGLTAGRHEGALQLASSGGSLTSNLSLDVESALRLSPGSLDFGTATTKMSLRIANDGDRAIDWSADPSTGWISLSPDSGRLPPKLNQLLTVEISRANLFHGTNQGVIQFSSNDGSSSLIVNASIVPAGGSNPTPSRAPKLTVTPVRLDFGATATELILIVQNEGDQALEWSGDPGAPWIGLPISSGRVAPHSHASVAVRFSRTNLSPGAYQSFVQLESNGGSFVTTVSAVVNSPGASPPPSTPPPPSPPPPGPAPAPKITISPAALNFGETATGLTLRIRNDGTATLTWSAQSPSPWVTLPTGSSGQLTPGGFTDLAVHVSRSDLVTPGEYVASIQFTSNGGNPTIPVSLRVPTQTLPPPPPPPPSSSGTVNVVDFGARGNDQIDDTSAFAAAIAALPAEGGTVRIPGGTYLFTAPSRSSIRRSIDLFRRSNVTLAGDGMHETVLRMAPGNTYSGDAHFISIERSTGITIRDLTVDGNRTNVTYVDEQSHGIELDGSSNVRIERVLATGMHGDGVRLLGLIDPIITWVEHVWIEDCQFSHNGRSGIAVQRLVRDVTIRGNTFTHIQDQAIDMEPSAANELTDVAPRNFKITNNRFYDTATLSLTITGVGNGDRARDIVVSDNEFDGTGIFIFNAVDVRIERNTIRSGYQWAPIEARKYSENLWIIENELDSSGASADKAAIVLAYHTSAAPIGVHVLNNNIRSGVNPGFSARDAEHLEIAGNTFSGQGDKGINIQDINLNTPLSDFKIENNRINGYHTGVRVVSDSDIMTDVCVRNNTFTDVVEYFYSKGPVKTGCN